jgi:hypothetical protein
MLAQRALRSLTLTVGLAVATLAVAAGCASSDSSSSSAEPRYNIIKGSQPTAQEGGIPPERQAEIQLLLQQRDASTRKCYQEVLNEKNDRAFAGTVRTIITLGTQGQATDVRIAGGTLNNSQVESCLVQAIKSFEFPKLESGGEVQYEFLFRPAY